MTKTIRRETGEKIEIKGVERVDSSWVERVGLALGKTAKEIELTIDMALGLNLYSVRVLSAEGREGFILVDYDPQFAQRYGNQEPHQLLSPHFGPEAYWFEELLEMKRDEMGEDPMGSGSEPKVWP